MNAAELKAYIDKVLGNSIRCLLPSYWWKRIFGLVIDDMNSVRAIVNNKPSKSDLTSLEKKIDAKLAEKISMKVLHNTSGSISYAYPDTVYVINPAYPVIADVTRLVEPTSDLGRYTFIMANVTHFLFVNDKILWVNGEQPSTLDPALHYEISVVATKMGNSFVFTAVLASFS